MTNGPEEPARATAQALLALHLVFRPRDARASSRRGPRERRTPLELAAGKATSEELGLEQSAADLLDGTSIDRLECERDALAAADAHGDEPEAVPTHRMDEAGIPHPARTAHLPT